MVVAMVRILAPAEIANARIQTAEEGEEHRLGTATGDDDIVGCYLDVIFIVVADEFLAIAQIALRG